MMDTRISTAQVARADALLDITAAELLADGFTDVGRIERGRRIVAQAGAVRLSGTVGAWLVRSECGHRWYVVSTGGGRCDCADSERRAPLDEYGLTPNGVACKHRAAVELYRRTEDELRHRALAIA
jgi:hypothetical protein